MKLFLSALMIAAFSLAPNLARAADNIVGVVLEVEGTAQITNTKGETYDAQVKSEVRPQDVITTGPASRLYIQFIDNTEFTLAENAQFTVEEYSFDESNKEKNYATYSVLQGAFLYVSGLVAKKDVPDVKVNIPQGSIGIRGTKFWGGIVDGEYGVIVGEGKVTVKNKAGSATLIKGQGTTLKDRVTKPTAPKKWSPAKIAKATATVTLKDSSAVGARMMEARAEQAALRAEHAAAQATIKRVPAAVLEEKIEQKILTINPEMRPDLLKEKLEALKATTPEGTQTNEDDKPTTLRERLEEERLNSVNPSTLKERLNSTIGTEGAVTNTVRETIQPLKTLTGKPPIEAPAPGTSTTTTTIRQTTDAVTDTGARAVTTTTQTTRAVVDTATDTVKSTTETLKSVTETPVLKPLSATPEKTTEPAAQPVEQKSSLPVTEAVKETLSTVGTTVEKVTTPVKNTVGGIVSTPAKILNTRNREPE